MGKTEGDGFWRWDKNIDEGSQKASLAKKLVLLQFTIFFNVVGSNSIKKSCHLPFKIQFFRNPAMIRSYHRRKSATNPVATRLLAFTLKNYALNYNKSYVSPTNNSTTTHKDKGCRCRANIRSTRNCVTDDGCDLSFRALST